MNKLKKLFSPSTLAATVAGGMLAHAAITALAADCFLTSGVWQYFPFTGCPSGSITCPYDGPNGKYYVCCPGGYPVCGGVDHFDHPYVFAYCCQWGG